MKSLATLTLRIASLVTLLVASPLAAFASDITIQGAPGALKALGKQAAAIEAAIGGKLKLVEQDPGRAIVPLHAGLVNGIAIGGTPQDFFAHLKTPKSDAGSLDDYDWLEYGQTTVMAVLHPDNPATSLTRAQIVDLLSGKLKTWEPINGRKDPVKIVFNRTQTAAVKTVPKYFLDKDEVPGAAYVTTLKGVAEALKRDPGTISFSGSRFEEGGLKPKFLDTDAKFSYTLGVKKPPSETMAKVFAALKAK